MKKILFVLLASFSSCFAGDIVDSFGAYGGTANKTFYSTSTGSYGGSIFKNNSLSDASGRYAGYIAKNGSIVDSRGAYGGFISRWKDIDSE